MRGWSLHLGIYGRFFDAEGHISLHFTGSLRLIVGQKFGNVLELLHRFLAGELGSIPGVRKRGSGFFCLEVSATPTSKYILQKMLQAGMVQKARQAKLAIGLTRVNLLETRSQLFELMGNQKRASRLDTHGLERARRITNASRRARYAVNKGQQDKASALRQELETLKLDHAFHKARLENERLSKYILMLRNMHQEQHLTGRETDRLENWRSAALDREAPRCLSSHEHACGSIFERPSLLVGLSNGLHPLIILPPSPKHLKPEVPVAASRANGA